MRKQHTSLGFAQSRKAVSFLFLVFFVMQFFSPVALVSTPTAQAQCSGGGCSGSASAAGGLGSLLGGGGGSMLEMVGQLMGMLMQLFQGGGTPQQGRAEEMPPQWASGAERFSSGLQNQNGTNPVNVYNPSTIPSTSLVTGNGLTLPSNVRLVKGGAITISNANTTPATIEIRHAGDNTSATTTSIASGDTRVFRFNSAGNYTLCSNASGANVCTTSIAVAN